MCTYLFAGFQLIAQRARTDTTTMTMTMQVGAAVLLEAVRNAMDVSGRERRGWGVGDEQFRFKPRDVNDLYTGRTFSPAWIGSAAKFTMAFAIYPRINTCILSPGPCV